MNASFSYVDIIYQTSIFDDIAEQLYLRGYAIVENAIPISLVEALATVASDQEEVTFTPAGIGRQEGYQQDTTIRRDKVSWIDRDHPVNVAYLDWTEALRLAINKRLFLGLFDYEAHYAKYDPNAFYKKHLDAFRGETNRVLSTVLYLNRDWHQEDGGELILYACDSDQVIERVLPEFGTLVIFLSEEFPHEVAPTARPRYSIAGWYRVNNTLMNQIDPPR